MVGVVVAVPAAAICALDYAFDWGDPERVCYIRKDWFNKI